MSVSSQHSSSRVWLRRIAFILAIIMLALILTAFTLTILPNARQAYREPCLTEDCIVARNQSGFPFKAVNYYYYEGLNCSYQSLLPVTCKYTDLTSPWALAGNFVFYLVLVWLVLGPMRRIIISKQKGTSSKKGT